MLKSATLAVLALTISAPAFAGQGADQMARILGVEPGAYTLSQLMDLDRAYKEDNAQAVSFILSQGNGGVSSRAAVVSETGVNPGKAQLAKILGVDVNAYTLSELVALDAARFE